MASYLSCSPTPSPPATLTPQIGTTELNQTCANITMDVCFIADGSASIELLETQNNVIYPTTFGYSATQWNDFYDCVDPQYRTTANPIYASVDAAWWTQWCNTLGHSSGCPAWG